MTEHMYLKSARQLADKTKANFHEVKGHFEGNHMANSQHPRVAAAQELSELADEHHKALAGYAQAQPQPSDMDWRTQVPTGQIPARRR